MAVQPLPESDRKPEDLIRAVVLFVEMVRFQGRTDTDYCQGFRDACCAVLDILVDPDGTQPTGIFEDNSAARDRNG